MPVNNRSPPVLRIARHEDIRTDLLHRRIRETERRLRTFKARAADLKSRGFRFVGPTTMLALMAAIGIVNTDIVGTHRRPR